MRKSNILLLIILTFAIAGGIFMIFTRESGKNPGGEEGTPAPAATATSAPTATPVPEATAAPTPEPTATPAPTSAPTAVPTATATASPSPTPYVDYASSGSFRSESGTWLNVVVYWETENVDGAVKLKLDAFVESYSLICAGTDDLVFNIGGEKHIDSSGTIVVGDDVGKVETRMGGYTAEVTSGKDITVSVTWYFMGSYGGRQIDSITASDTIHIP